MIQVAHALPEPFLGPSEPARRLRAQAERLARSRAPVLIEGEAGAGKTHLARFVHSLSDRASRPLQVVDCAAIPPTLFARELFGHERGAFTGADCRQPGRVEAASGGSVLFEEIQSLGIESQAALLRVLDGGEILPLGANRPLAVDVRFLQTSQATLEEEVERGKFRSDLYYRLQALRLRIPPLRERREDVAFFIEHFLRRESLALRRPVPELSDALRAMLLRHAWPGNLQELRHVLVGLLTVVGGNRLDVCHLTEEVRERLQGVRNSTPATRTFSIPAALPFQRQVETFQRALLQRVWGEAKGDRRLLLERLQLAPHQLKYLIRKLGMQGLPGDEGGGGEGAG